MVRKLLFPILFIVSVCSFVIACDDEDDDDNENNGPKPTIVLNGQARDTTILNTSYADPGATATDVNGNDISAKVFVNGTVNKDKAGSYTIRYNVTNDAGAVSNTLTRTVIVYNEASYLNGSYIAAHRCATSFIPTPDFPTSVTASNSVNNSIIFDKIAPVSGTIAATLSGRNLVIPVGFDQNNVRYEGFGVVSNNNMEITFRTDSTGYGSCIIDIPL